jgi:hypothetical protein
MTYTVRTPFLFWFGAFALAVSLGITISAWGNWMVVFVLTALFGSSGAALLLMSAHVTGNLHGLKVRRPHKTSEVSWSEITASEIGGGNLVFKTKNGRVVAPSFEFWWGKDKILLMALVANKLHEQGISIRTTLRAAAAPDDR